MQLRSSLRFNNLWLNTVFLALPYIRRMTWTSLNTPIGEQHLHATLEELRHEAEVLQRVCSYGWNARNLSSNRDTAVRGPHSSLISGIAKGAGRKGPRQKYEDKSRHFLTVFRAGQETSKIVKKCFRQFTYGTNLPAPFGGSELRTIVQPPVATSTSGSKRTLQMSANILPSKHCSH